MVAPCVKRRRVAAAQAAAVEEAVEEAVEMPVVQPAAPVKKAPVKKAPVTAPKKKSTFFGSKTKKAE